MSSMFLVSHKNRSCQNDIYVVRDIAHNLLGLPTIMGLNLLVLMYAIHQSDRATLQQKFPSLFTRLGTLQNKYDIRLKPDAKPFALYTASRGGSRIFERGFLLKSFVTALEKVETKKKKNKGHQLFQTDFLSQNSCFTS